MKNRQLDETERRVTEKNLKRLKENKKYLEYSLEHTNFMLDKGLDLRMYSLRKAKDSEKKVLLQELAEANAIIDISEEQLKNGVPAKKEENKESEE